MRQEEEKEEKGRRTLGLLSIGLLSCGALGCVVLCVFERMRRPLPTIASMHSWPVPLSFLSGTHCTPFHVHYSIVHHCTHTLRVRVTKVWSVLYTGANALAYQSLCTKVLESDCRPQRIPMALALHFKCPNLWMLGPWHGSQDLLRSSPDRGQT